jgi:hypothetical protein
MIRRKGTAPRAAGPAATPEPAIYYKTPVTPEEAFQAIGRLRREAREEIDRLIRFLDDTDNHMELEDSIDDNPHDDEGEAEPSLGSFDRMADQSKAWRQTEGELCYSADAEQDDADSEDSDPAEPSLGSLERQEWADQERWGFGDRRDLEQDDGESGISDQDGLDEQVPFRDWQMVGMV